MWSEVASGRNRAHRRHQRRTRHWQEPPGDRTLRADRHAGKPPHPLSVFAIPSRDATLSGDRASRIDHGLHRGLKTEERLDRIEGLVCGRHRLPPSDVRYIAALMSVPFAAPLWRDHRKPAPRQGGNAADPDGDDRVRVVGGPGRHAVRGSCTGRMRLRWKQSISSCLCSTSFRCSWWQLTGPNSTPRWAEAPSAD